MATYSSNDEYKDRLPGKDSSSGVGKVPTPDDSASVNQVPEDSGVYDYSQDGADVPDVDLSGEMPASVKRVDSSKASAAEGMGAQGAAPTVPGAASKAASGMPTPGSVGNMASIGKVDPSLAAGMANPANVMPASIARVSPQSVSDAASKAAGDMTGEAKQKLGDDNPSNDEDSSKDDSSKSEDNGEQGSGNQDGDMSAETGDKGSSDQDSTSGSLDGSSSDGGSKKGSKAGSKNGSQVAQASRAAAKNALKSAAPAAAKGAGAGASFAAGVGAAPHVAAAAATGVGAVISQMGAMLAGAGHAAITAITGVITGIAGFVSSVLGVTATTATIATVSATVALVGSIAAVTVAGMASVITAQQANFLEPTVDDCRTGMEETIDEGGLASDAETPTGDSYNEATEEKFAQKVWMLCKALGWDDIHAAGAIGNYHVECQLDSTSVEGIYDEPYYFGPKKQAVINDMDNYTRNTLFPALRRVGITPHPYYTQTSTGEAYCGIGLMSWTGPGAERLLALAQEYGQDWYDINFQIALMFSRGSGLVDDPNAQNDQNTVSQYAAKSFATVEEAATEFSDHVEGNQARLKLAERIQSAKDWYAKMPTWTVDQSYVDSITNMISDLGSEATETEVESERTTCSEMNCVSVGSMPSAAVAMAYATQEEATQDLGTEVYRAVRKALFPDDPESLNMSCDRGVAAIVRWSGADMDYPVGACAQQREYVLSSSKWEQVVDNFDGSQMDQLEPGDVFLTKETGGGSGAHTLMYVGSDIIEKTFKGAAAPGSDFCHASYGSRSLSCSTYPIADYVKSDSRHYDVFRCVHPDGAKTSSYAGASVVATEICTEEEEYGEGETVEGNKIVEAAKITPWPGASLCATWTTRVYEKAGFPAPTGNANNQYYDHCKSSDRADLVPGMLVAVPTHNKTYMGSIYGHVGIYIGDNTIMHSVSTGVETMNLDKWIEFYGEVATPKWGWGFSAPVTLHYINSGSSGGSDLNSKLGKGTTIKVPSGLGTYYTVTGYGKQGIWYADGSSTPWASGTLQKEVWNLWVKKGRKYKNGIATIGGRYLVAMTSTFGKVGDAVTITLKNGQKLSCIIADEKSQQYCEWDHNPANKWGHDNGKCMVEFEVNMDWYHKYGNPGTKNWCPQWGGTSTKSVKHYSSVLKKK